jgi:hypothetical protein
MSTTPRTPKRSVQEVLKASNALRVALSRVREEDSRLKEIGVRVGGKPEGPETPKAQSRLIVTIEADTQAHAEEHAKALEDEGCTCTSTGDTSVECDCSDVA